MTADYALLRLDEYELDAAIGAAISAGEFGAKDLSESEKQRRGAIWYDLHLPDLRAALCGQAFVAKYTEADSTAERELFDAIVALLASAVGVPVPVGVLAAKTIRYGVGRLCAFDEPAEVIT